MGTTDLTGVYTLMDIINAYTSLDAKGSYLYAAEVLARKCPFIADMPMKPSNNLFQNVDARRTYLSSPGTRRFNEGVAPSASHTTPFTDPIAMVEDYSEVDYALWQIQNDPNSWRQGEDKAKIESLSQKMEALILYGSLASDPAAFNGICTRFNVLASVPNGDTTWPYNVTNNGGSSSVVSALVIEWGPDKVFGIYPKNLPAGLKVEDLGKVTVNTGSEAAPKYMEALRTHFCWYMGLVIKDERCVQRLANIEQTAASNTLNDDKLIDCINNLPGAGDGGNTVIYVNRYVKGQFDKMAKDKTNTFYTQDAAGDAWGRRVTKFMGIPVKMAEKITTESTIA
jgi:hypothetical protein